MSQSMTATKTDHQSSLLSWADGPHALITIPSTTEDIKSHGALYSANEMALAHNVIIRGLNSILLQGPYVATHNKQDIRDFLVYIAAFVRTVDHHHHTEETVMFPRMAEILGDKGLFDHSGKQHELFHDGLERLGVRVKELLADETTYNWDEIKKILDGFAPAMMEHLMDEIELLKGFTRFNSDLVMKGFKEAETAAKASGRLDVLYDIFPFALGNCDKTHAGSENFPPVPFVIPLAVKWWFAGYNKGAWRFCPSDFDRQPRPLHASPQV